MTDSTATDRLGEPFAFWTRRERLAVRLLGYGLPALVTIADVGVRGGFTSHARTDIVLSVAAAVTEAFDRGLLTPRNRRW